MDDDVIIEFGTGGNAPGLTRGGWSVPEPGFRWMVGLESFVELPRPPVAARYGLSLALIPHIRPPRLPKQSLIVAVNDVIVTVCEVERAMTVACDVPHWVIALFEAVTVRLVHPHAAAPSDIADLPDQRLLALAVERLVLRPYAVVRPGEKLQPPETGTAAPPDAQGSTAELSRQASLPARAADAPAASPSRPGRGRSAPRST